MSKQWYAAYRPYGVHTLNTNGPRADVLYRFPTKAERDAWVDGDPEHCEEMPASNDELRAALRFEKRIGYAVVRSLTSHD